MARFTGGWVKIHREVVDKDLSENVYLWGLWHWLLLTANYKASQIIWNGKQRILEPGQNLITIREIAEKWDCSGKTIHKWLHYLRDTGRIALESVTHGTIVTICNWKEYQILEDSEVTPSKHEVNTKETPSKHQVNNSEEVQEEKKIKKERKNIGGIRTDYPPVFVSLWDAYGKVGTKSAALKAFQKLTLGENEIENLKEAIKNYYARKEGWKSPMHLSTFLNSDWRIYLEAVEPHRASNRDNVFDFLPHYQTKENK